MNPDPFVFAMANPNPEVKPEEAAPYVRVMATGRSDYPNQINNVLAFPGIFRGALDVRATAITEEMKLAAARGSRRSSATTSSTRTTSSRASSTATWRARWRAPCRGGRARRRGAEPRSSRRSSAPPSADAGRRHRRDRHDRPLIGARGARRRGHRALAGDEVAAPALGARPNWPQPKAEPPPLDALRGRDAVVHLLGEQIAQRWSDDAKREIRDSRILSTRNLVTPSASCPRASGRACSSRSPAPAGTGTAGDERLDESAPAGDDFLAQLSADWEAEARRAEELGVRVVVNRTGMVLSESGGALEKMLPFFKAGIGGPVAGGRQYVPWVHLDDVVGAILFELDTEAASGPST